MSYLGYYAKGTGKKCQAVIIMATFHLGEISYSFIRFYLFILPCLFTYFINIVEHLLNDWNLLDAGENDVL